MHVRVTFDRPVTGPIVAGNMGHVGLGLLIPDAEQAPVADPIAGGGDEP